MTRRVVWLQVLIGWLPVWALFTVQIHMMHSGHVGGAAIASLRMMLAAALLGLVVNRLTERLPWPRTILISFVLIHLLCAFAFGATWFVLNSVIESMLRGAPVLVIPFGVGSFVLLGVWLYAMVAGVSYAQQATERAARAEATATKAQLAALRSQLNPHFLFNALHTVVHLIPREPKRAAHAAEQLADLLRGAIDADHDTVTLSAELAFVEKYLSLEHIRFDNRLRVRIDATDEARAAMVPSFSVQSLVENSVRHGATPRVEPTDVTITARIVNRALLIAVSDNGAGGEPSTQGTGLKRLRERIAALYGGGAKLEAGPTPAGGWSASLTIPLEHAD